MEEKEDHHHNHQNPSDSTITTSLIHVLAVDDCFLDRKIVEKVLKSASFKVTSVDSGKKAMQVLGLSKDENDKSCCQVEKIDIILTDYCMPEMNGHDLLVTVKENSRTKSIPVVIISSEYDRLRINRCMADGAEDFLQKPLQIEDLQKLRSYASRPTNPVPKSKTGTKRKMKLDLITEGSAAERRPRVAAGVAVA